MGTGSDTGFAEFISVVCQIPKQDLEHMSESLKELHDATVKRTPSPEWEALKLFVRQNMSDKEMLARNPDKYWGRLTAFDTVLAKMAELEGNS